MNFLFDTEPTWEEIYYLVESSGARVKKDTSFTDNDIIRIFHNNLSWEEQEEVKEYFCQVICADSPDTPEDPSLPNAPTFPLLPIPFMPALPAPVPKSLPPPPPKALPLLPVKLPLFLLPVWPFVIIEALPADVRNYLQRNICPAPQAQVCPETPPPDLANVFDLQHAIVDAFDAINELKDQVRYWKFMAESLPETKTVYITQIIEEKPTKTTSDWDDDDEKWYDTDDEDWWTRDEYMDEYDEVEVSRPKLLQLVDSIAQKASTYGLEVELHGWITVGERTTIYILVDGKRFAFTLETLVEAEKNIEILLKEVL